MEPTPPPPSSLAAQIFQSKQVKKTGSPMEPSKMEISYDNVDNVKARHDWFIQPAVVDRNRNSRGILGARPEIIQPAVIDRNRNTRGILGARPEIIQPSVIDRYRNTRGIIGARPEMNTGFKTQPSSPVNYFESSEIAEANADFYMRAKIAEMQGDLERACSLYYSAINDNDKYDSSVKDLAAVLKRLNRTNEAIVLIEEHLEHCSPEYKYSVQNQLLNLYKGSGKIDEYIQLLEEKLELGEEGSAFDRKRTKIAGTQGRKCHVSIKQQRSRLLGSLAWAYMQQENYDRAEQLYREALLIEPDKNHQCNLAICLMRSEFFSKANSLLEAKSLLKAVTPSSEERKIPASYIKAYDRALETLAELENGDTIED